MNSEIFTTNFPVDNMITQDSDDPKMNKEQSRIVLQTQLLTYWIADKKAVDVTFGCHWK